MKIPFSIRFLALSVLCFPVLAHATVQEACFETLKQNINEVGSFPDAVTELSDTTYPDLAFSPYYKNLSSFGLDLKDPLFHIRVYSFGRQTGYVHPPLSPYPTSTKSDRWEDAAKEHVILEEYIQDPERNLVFLGCGYIRIESEDLEAVTRDRYVYDGELMSVLKADTEYQAWYNQNLSFDEDAKHFVTWKRLFVYPKETDNRFFSRYGVAEAFPSNQVDSFEVLSPEVDGENDLDIIAYGSNGKIKSTSVKALEPVRLPENEVFPMNSYYRAIDAKFPQMGEQLSIRGLVSYPQMKQLIASRDETTTKSVWSVLVDTRDVTQYYQAKSRGEITKEDQIFENMLDRIETVDQEVKELVGAPPEEAKKETMNADSSDENLGGMDVEDLSADVEQETEINLGLFGLFILVLIVVGILIKKKS